VIKLARERRRLTLATVESCTAGALAHLLSQADGASEVLHGGFVVYTKENKTRAVGVPPAHIANYGAVSAEVAQAMAAGGLERSPTAISLSITGVAGPEPDEDGNPVGLVFVAAAASDGRARVIRHHFGKQDVCEKAMVSALELAQDLLLAQVP
jgi:nicotinamide-nucleotide amidase